VILTLEGRVNGSLSQSQRLVGRFCCSLVIQIVESAAEFYRIINPAHCQLSANLSIMSERHCPVGFLHLFRKLASVYRFVYLRPAISPLLLLPTRIPIHQVRVLSEDGCWDGVRFGIVKIV